MEPLPCEPRSLRRHGSASLRASHPKPPSAGAQRAPRRLIDGYLHFRDADNKPQLGIISVKGGGTNSGHVRDLKGTMERRTRRSAYS
jgi:hypothetical protein